MTLPASGPLAMTDIQTEFGGTNPIGLNEYYAGGGLVPPGTSGTYGAVPSSGALSIQNFYGTSNFVPIYIEDVFSTWLYTGNGATQTITNGIDLAGEGGMVWTKRRDGAAWYHHLGDTVRGAGNILFSNATDGNTTGTGAFTAFSSTGFSFGAAQSPSGVNFVSWTFRKQPKFFDIQTFTTTYNVNPNVISHNLGGELGCAIFKQLNSTGQGINWIVYHRSLGTGKYLKLNTTASTITDAQSFVAVNNTAGTISFGYPMSDIDDRLVSGGTETTNWVGYFFAHDAGGFGLNGTDNVISCGSFTTDGDGNATIDLGYEPQWVMYKRTDGTSNWRMFDNMRGMSTSGITGGDAFLSANLSSAEGVTNVIAPQATGFSLAGEFGVFASGIYIAIRRGPMKVPESGTSVFDAFSSSAAQGTVRTTNFPVDMQMARLNANNSGTNSAFLDRLRGVSTTTSTVNSRYLASSTDVAESTALGTTQEWNNTGFSKSSYYNSIQSLYYSFRRAPGFFDEVCYTGTGVARTVAHNLTVVPELMIVKCRSSSASWLVYSAATGSRWYLVLNTTREKAEDTAVWNNTTPTASVFSLGNAWVEANQSGQTYVAYLFASCPGVSKAGGYTGTGTTQTINCGFTTGARFVLIKRTDADGFAWYVWDSARGITSGNDPYLLLNATGAEVTGTNYVDTTSVGFQVTAAAPAAINASGGTYIFLAIA